MDGRALVLAPPAPTVMAAAALLACAAAVPRVQAADELKVVATIKPVHSLVAAVMEGAGRPHLLVKGAGSPHGFAMRPSDARALYQADAVFMVSPELEVFLGRALRSLRGSVQVIRLADIPGLTRHKMRRGGIFLDPGRAGGTGTTGNDAHAGHAATHIWLDPLNAKAIVTHVARVLGELRPAAAPLFNANATALTARLDALSAELAKALKPAAGKPYVVYHDAYQYLERRYGLAPIGSVSSSPDQQPGARRIAALRARISALGGACIFTEPQFEPKLARIISEGTSAQVAILDPLGAALAPGPDLYFKLMRNLAAGLNACLAR